MLGNFSYCNPAKIYFGDQALRHLATEISQYGKNVVLLYGGGSIRRNGIYDVRVVHIPGNLTDHYNPGNKTLGLSDTVYQ